MKDVIILGIQQYRISALFSSHFFHPVWIDSQTIQKCDTSIRKPCVLCLRRAEVSCVIDAVCFYELFCGSPSGGGLEEGQS